MTPNNCLYCPHSLIGLVLLISCVATWADQCNPRSSFLDTSYSKLILKNESSKTYNLEQRPDGLSQFYLDGAPYENNATRFLAIYHSPNIPLISDGSMAARAPAVVLVHGGGGTAFGEWVKRWNDAGMKLEKTGKMLE